MPQNKSNVNTITVNHIMSEVIMKNGDLIRVIRLVMVFLFVIVVIPASYAGMGELFNISVTTQQEGCVSAAFDGENFLAGIQGNNLAHDGISWQLISRTGELIGTKVNQGSFGGMPLVGFGNGKYLVVWDTAGDGDTPIYGQLVSTNGIIAGATLQISSSTGDVELSDLSNVPFGDGKFLVTWEDYRSGAGDEPDIYGQLITTDGILFGGEIPIAIDNSSGNNGDDDDKEASADFDGTNFLVVFTAERRSGLYDREDVYGQFVSPSGSLIGSNFVIDENDIPSPNPTQTCWDGEKYTILFHEGIEEIEEQWDIYARFVSPAGVVATNRIAIATSPIDSEQFPSIAYNGTNYLITVSCMLGVSAITPNGTNWISRARFFDKQLQPETPWFTIYDPTTVGVFPFTGTVSGNEEFVVGISLLDGNDNFSDVYGVIVNSAPPAVSSFEIQGTTANISLANLFPGNTNKILRNSSLTTTNWILDSKFICTSPSTNWTCSTSNNWHKMFYRLQME